VRACLDAARAEAGDPSLSTEAVIALFLQWIDEDRKVTPLKTLQGLIWADGYTRGELRGHVYDDAAEYLRIWHAAGHRLHVFSSGSIAAQKLLFGHTSHGDLTPLFSGYFDTTTGPKLENSSYSKIAAAIGRAAGEVLFLSDHTGELDAAAAAGMRTACLDRGEVVIPPDTPHRRYRSFAEIDPERA
jgi:enolase-phosphatase E1